MLEQMSEKDAAYIIQQATSMVQVADDKLTSSDDEASSSDDAADTQTRQQKLFGFRDRLPEMAARAKESIRSNIVGDETDSESDYDHAGTRENVQQSFDPARLSEGTTLKLSLCI